jgi:hypothetical protein
LITLFDGAFRALSVSVDMAQSERLAMVVQFAMDSKVRAYHTTAHIFGLCEGLNPCQVLAALFHDLVYYQLDGGPPESTVGILHGVAVEQDGVPFHKTTARWRSARLFLTWCQGKRCSCMRV